MTSDQLIGMGLILAGSASLAVTLLTYLGNRLFDDNDPDLYWHDAQAGPEPQKGCKHSRTFKKVLSTAVTCETTVTACMDCGKELTEHKTDC